MKLKEYIKNLQKFVKENPDAANYTCVYSKDDEGNSYHEVLYTPSIGSFDGNSDWVSDDGTKEFSEEYEKNSVCLN